MPYQSAPRPARRSSTARGAGRARRPPRTRPATRPDLLHSLLAGLLDTQHTRTLAPPDHCAADCTPRQPRSTRRGARGTSRALPGGSARNASPLMPVHSCATIHLHTPARLTHCATACALRKQQLTTQVSTQLAARTTQLAPSHACTLASHAWPAPSSSSTKKKTEKEKNIPHRQISPELSTCQKKTLLWETNEGVVCVAPLPMTAGDATLTVRWNSPVR